MSNFHSFTCPQCGGQIQLSDRTMRLKCPYCGTEQILTGEAARQLQNEGLLVCPICKLTDQLEKVSAILIKESETNPSRLAKMLTLPLPDYENLQASQLPEPLAAIPSRSTSFVPVEPAKPAKGSALLAIVILGIVFCFFLCIWFVALPYLEWNKTTFLIFGAIIYIFTGAIGMAYLMFGGRNGVSPSNTIPGILFIFVFLSAFSFAFIYLVISNGKVDLLTLFLTLISIAIEAIAVRDLITKLPVALRKASSAAFLSKPSEQVSLLERAQKEQSQKKNGVLPARIDLVRKEKDANRRKAEIYQQNLEIWNDLYYCHRDDCVCIPHKGLFASSSDMGSFIQLILKRNQGKSL